MTILKVSSSFDGVNVLLAEYPHAQPVFFPAQIGWDGEHYDKAKMQAALEAWAARQDRCDRLNSGTATQADLDAIKAEEAALPVSPAVFETGIETPLLSLLSYDDRLGIGVVADNQGNLVSFLWHSSPPPNQAEPKARIDAAFAQRTAVKAEISDAAKKFKAKTAAAKNVPDIRTALQFLDARLTALETLMGVQSE